MDEIFIERIVKRKVDIKGMLLRVLAVVLTVLSLCTILFLGMLGLTLTIFFAYLTYLVLSLIHISIYSTLNELKNLNPDFISVTYGAGGKGVAKATTIDLCSYIKNELGTETIAHLSCLYNTKESIDRILDELDEKGVKNILALRGDVNPDFAIEKDFKYASDLTEYIRSKNRGFNVSGACYPEVHQEAANMIEDIQNLKKKVDSGADHLISQLFFDNQVFFDFQEKARIAGINVPIEAGIMPVTNKKQIERMAVSYTHLSGLIFTVVGAIVLYVVLTFVYKDTFSSQTLGSYIGAYVITYYINMSIVLAFAATYPEEQLMLYFIIPIKIKWFGVLYGAYILIDIYNAFSYARQIGTYVLAIITTVLIVMSLLNFILYFISLKKNGGAFSVAQACLLYTSTDYWFNISIKDN